MKGVIIAGGTGSRLYPLTKVVNKHLLPVGRMPMILHTIYKLKDAGIIDIIIIIGKHSAGLYTALLGSGEEWGVRLSYRLQEQAGGIAEALALAEPFILPHEKMIVLLGDNLFEDSLTPFIDAYKQQEAGARVLLKEVDSPKRYGCPHLQDGKILAIDEKPENPRSSYCVTGIYMYGHEVFDIIRTIKPSDRGELEITDVNNAYIAHSQLAYGVLDGWWNDAGTFESLLEASQQLMGKSPL